MDFTCDNCKRKISIVAPGTRQRNHCPHCLWSKHLDDAFPGDRKSLCNGLMKPVGLVAQNSRNDKYTGKESFEICIIHKCLECGRQVVNRIAGDDSEKEVLALLYKTFESDKYTVLSEKDVQKVKSALLGNQ